MKNIAVSVGVVILVIVAGYFLLHHKISTPVVATDNGQQPVQLVDGRQCYTFSHEGTKDEPYTVHEFLDITIAGKNVTGTKTGTQSGPDMTNGYKGTISGTLENNAITDVFDYVIEGSSNKEQELYRANLTGIEKLRYPLMEGKNQMLVPDTSQSVKILNYARVECTGSN